MLLFDLLRISSPEILETESKIHLAVSDGQDDPVDVFLAGAFEEWQSWQKRRNFQRKFIVSLLQLPGGNRWLFAGCFLSKGCKYFEQDSHYLYQTSEIAELHALAGRLIVTFSRQGRQTYLRAENWADTVEVHELKPEKLAVEEFAGYNKIKLSKSRLEIIVLHAVPSWKGALSNVSGVYLITDTKTGKLYVGSATGEGGIWQRWSAYAATGHGGNRDLIDVLNRLGNEYSQHFQYSVLEIADTHASIADVKARESYWKDVLCSRAHGYNAN